MASLTTTSLSMITSLIISLITLSSTTTISSPNPTPWPHQFHSILFMNQSGTLQHLNLCLSQPFEAKADDLEINISSAANLRMIGQMDAILTSFRTSWESSHDLEWNNGTSYIYTLDENKECKVLHVEVGILRPNWLDGAEYLGQEYKDGFLCNVWTKVEFIWYYEDVVTKRPVFWVFYTGYSAHVMTFEVGKVLEDPKWQAPVYCFKEDEESTFVTLNVADNGVHGSLMRGIIDTPMNKASDI